MEIDWVVTILSLIAAMIFGAIIKILSIVHSLHKKEVEALKAAQEVGKEERKLLLTKLDIQKGDYEQRILQKDEFIRHYQNMLSAELHEKIQHAGISVDVTDPKPIHIENDIANGIKEIIDRIERLEEGKFLPDAETSLHLFEFYYNKQDYLRAAQLLERAISLGEVSGKYYFELGVTYNNGGEYVKAQKAYENALKHIPNDAMVWSYHGSVLKKLNRLDEAKISLLHALDIDPDCDDAHYNLAGVYAMQEKLEDCFKHLEKAIHIDPRWKYHAPLRPYFNNVRGYPKFIQLITEK